MCEFPACRSPAIYSTLLMAKRRRPRSSLFPYTTLFRSIAVVRTSASPTSPARGDVRLAQQIHRPSARDRKSTRLNSSHGYISYAVFCLKKKAAVALDVYLRFLVDLQPASPPTVLKRIRP